MGREIPNTNQIKAFMHCVLCSREVPEGQSMKEYARLEMGFTELGIQVWCLRHACNVVHVDFEGQKHPANKTINVNEDVEVRQKQLEEFRTKSRARFIRGEDGEGRVVGGSGRRGGFGRE